MPHPLLNKPAPTITCPNADGEDFTFTPGASGKPAVVFFVPSVGMWTTLLPPHPFVNLACHTGTYGCSREMCGFRDQLIGE